MPGLHVDSPAGSSVMEGRYHLRCTDKGRKEGLEWLIDLSRVTSWTRQGGHVHWHWIALFYSFTLGHIRPPFMDHDGCGSFRILAYFPNYTKFSAKKSSTLTSDISVAFAPGLISICPYSETLDHIALRKPYSLNISPWALPSSQVDLWYSHLLAGASRLARIDYSLCLNKCCSGGGSWVHVGD